MKTKMKNSSKYTLILADDHILLRDALANLINNFEDFCVAGVASNGLEVQESIAKGQKADIALLDLSMPGMDGYETARWLKEFHPNIKVLILTMYDSEIALIRMLQAGVRGFLKKDIHPNELRTALLCVAENGYYYSHNTTGKLAGLFAKNHERNTPMEKSILTDIEIEFLKLASTDMTYKEIAQKMHLSPRHIDNYRDTLFEKLDVKSRVGLAIYAVKNGIIQL